MSAAVQHDASASDSDPEFTEMNRKGSPFPASPAAGILRAQPVTGSTVKVRKMFTASKRSSFPGVDVLEFVSDGFEAQKQRSVVVTKPLRASDGVKKSRASEDFDLVLEDDSDCAIVEVPKKPKISVAAQLWHASNAFERGTGGLEYDSDGFEVQKKPRKPKPSFVATASRTSNSLDTAFDTLAESSDGFGDRVKKPTLDVATKIQVASVRRREGVDDVIMLDGSSGDYESSDGFEEKKPKRKTATKLQQVAKPVLPVEKTNDSDEDDDSSSSGEEEQEAPTQKKKKKPRKTLDAIMADFVYSTPLKGPLPSIRSFQAPHCGCRFLGTMTRKAPRTTIPKKAVLTTYGKVKKWRFLPGVPTAEGGKLRSYKCQGWEIDGVSVKLDGSPMFRRKKGYSEATTGCLPMVIDEATKWNDEGLVLEVRLSEEAEEYFRSEEARKGFK